MISTETFLAIGIQESYGYAFSVQFNSDTDKRDVLLEKAQEALHKYAPDVDMDQNHILIVRNTADGPAVIIDQ